MMLHTKLLWCKAFTVSFCFFDKVDECIRKYDGTKYLTLFHSHEKYERLFDRIRYLIMFKSNIWGVNSHKYMEIKINSGDILPLEKGLNMPNVVLLKSVINKNHNHYYHNIYFKKFSNIF